MGTRRRAGLLAAAAAGGLLLLASGAAEACPPLCPLRRFAGIPCASCGMTRALGALARGDAAAAWSYHPASFPLALAGAAAFALLAAEAATGRELLAPAWARVRPGAGWALAAVLVAGCILRAP